MRLSRVLLASLGLLLWRGAAHALDLHTERGSPYDLALVGKLAGVPSGQTRYVRWTDLRALPTTQLTLNGEFTAGDQALTVVFLEDLWKALPTAPGADTFFAVCVDGYRSVYTSVFIAKYRPFLVLEINGKGPADWPPEGLDYNPGPYVITVSSALVPAAASYRDIGHKKPWGVVTLEVDTYAERERGILTGSRASLSPAAQDGREVWVNSCACCHAGPAGIAGGTRAGRPFEVLAAYAKYDPNFFNQYIRKPKSIMPCAKMEPHPDYTERDLADLIAFMTVDMR